MVTGQQLYDFISKHVGEKYQLGVLVPKSNKNYHGPWDCAEIDAYGIYQLTSQLYGCYNNKGNPNSADAYTGYMSRDAEHIGKIITINDAWKTPGALVLRKAAGGRTGHIVCSDGHGKTAEAHSTKMGVILSVITGRRWDYGILPPMIDYSQQSDVTDPIIKILNQKPKGVIYRFTDELMADLQEDGPIHEIQSKLKAANYYSKDIDGVYGFATFRAVRLYQRDHGLVTDGEVGNTTLQALGLKLAA